MRRSQRHLLAKIGKHEQAVEELKKAVELNPLIAYKVRLARSLVELDQFLEAGIDCLNMQQPRCYGIEEIGEKFGGKIAFLTTADIQATLPSGDLDAIREEAELLVKCWSTPQGGLVVFNYGDPEALGVRPEAAEVMFRAFGDLQEFWR